MMFLNDLKSNVHNIICECLFTVWKIFYNLPSGFVLSAQEGDEWCRRKLEEGEGAQEASGNKTTKKKGISEKHNISHFHVSHPYCR